jgi:hypothetical protein
MKFFIIDRLYGDVLKVNELNFENRLEKDNGVFFSSRMMSDLYIGDNFMFVMMK